MKIEHTIPEPYGAHVKETRAQIEQLELKRDQALAAVYQFEREIGYLTKHVQALMELQIKEHELPKGQGAYQLDRAGRLVANIPDGVQKDGLAQ